MDGRDQQAVAQRYPGVRHSPPGEQPLRNRHAHARRAASPLRVPVAPAVQAVQAVRAVHDTLGARSDCVRQVHRLVAGACNGDIGSGEPGHRARGVALVLLPEPDGVQVLLRIFRPSSAASGGSKRTAEEQAHPP